MINLCSRPTGEQTDLLIQPTDIKATPRQQTKHADDDDAGFGRGMERLDLWNWGFAL